MKQNILTMKWTAGIAALALTMLLGKASSTNVPGAVTMLNTTGVAVHGDHNITQLIAWERPPGHVGTLEYVITYIGYTYRYEYSYTYGYNSWGWYHTHNTTTATTAQTSFNLTLPTPTTITLYTVSVAARSTAGKGEAVQRNISYSRPDRPFNVQTLNSTCNSIAVTWEAPVNTGGLELLGYRIDVYPTNFRREVGTNETKQIVIIPEVMLMQYTLYVPLNIRVSAINSISSGKHSKTRRNWYIMPKDEVGMTAMSPSNAEIEVSITTPQTYTCSAREMDAKEYTHINTTSDGIGLFQGLKSNTSYRINCTGVDDVCIIANTTAITRNGVPSAVTMLSLNTTGVAIHGDPNITQLIAWERPPGHVGTVEYVITYTRYVYRHTYFVKYRNNRYDWLFRSIITATTTQTSFNLSLPTPKRVTRYTVSVAARSAAGLGEAVQRNLNYRGPYSPVNTQAHNITCNSITVTWEAPVNTGGLELLGYRIELYPTNFRREVGTNETKQIVIPDLVQSTRYSIAVIAINSISEVSNTRRRSTAAKDEGELLAVNIKATSVTLRHLLGKDVNYRCNVTTETSKDQFNITGGVRNTLSGLSADTTHTVNCAAYRDGLDYCLEAMTTFRTLPGAVAMLNRTGVAIHGDPNITQPIAWERPPDHMSILEYVITVYTGYSYTYGYNGWGWYHTLNTTTATTQTSFNLSLPTPTANTLYTVSVAARSAVGQGEAASITVKYGGPDSPVNVQTLNITCNSITVTWEAPVNTGGLELLGYRIELYYPTNFRREVGTNETKQIVLPNLNQSTYYYGTVIAENSISKSYQSYIHESTVAKDEGELIEASIKATSVTLYHLLGNEVHYRCNVLNETSTNLQLFNITSGEGYILSGLSADTTYTVNCAVYRGGVEYCLEETKTFITSPVATVTDATSTSVDYYLEFGLKYNCTLLGKDNEVADTHKNVDLEKRQTFHGLTPGQKYSIRCSNRYRVFGVNTTFTTLEAPASEPKSLEGSASGSSYIRLTWQQPDFPNGVITSYVITYNEVPVDTSSASLGYTLTGLQPFTTYNISVAARNGAGVGEVSREIRVKTRPGVPGAPTIARWNINTTCQSFQISWTPPVNTGGDEIMYYTVTYYVSGAVKNHKNHSTYVNAALVTLDQLTPNTEYTVIVRARNSEQTGQAAHITVRTDSRDPISLRIIPFSPTEIIVIILPPPLQNSIGEAYTYSLSFVPNHLRVSPFNTSSTYEIFTGLQANTEYNVTSLVYKIGKGLCYEGMATGTTLPDTPPSRIWNLNVTRVTSTTIELRWERPRRTNGPITSYAITYNGVQVDTRHSVSLKYNLTGLQPFTTYTISVAARNGAGVGKESQKITATTLEGVPGNVLKLRTVGVAIHGEPYITQPIAWERPPGHMSILKYVITISNTKTSQIAKALTNQTSFNLSLPTPRDSINYEVSVAARSAVGQGKAASITIQYRGPDSPVNTQAHNSTCNSITVTWEAPVNTGGLELLAYRIEESTTSFVKEIGPHDVKEAFISNLTQKTDYTINVSAINSIAAIPDRTAVRTQAKDPIPVKIVPFFSTGPGIIILITPPQFGDGIPYNYSLVLSPNHPTAAFTYHTSSRAYIIPSLRANTEYHVICTVYKGKQELCYEGTATGRTP